MKMDVGWNETKEGREKKKKKNIGKEERVLDQISNVHGHFLHSSIVEGFNVSERALVIFGNHVDSDALSTKTSTTADSTRKTKQNKHHYTTATKCTNQTTITTEKKLLDSPVNIVLPVGWKVIVDNQRNLLHINASSL